MSAKVKVGIVGVGFMGNLHAKHYFEHEQCELIGVADSDQSRVELIAETYNCAAYTDFRQLIGKVDAISIAVPPTEHPMITEVFLASDVHILLEKPVAVTVADAENIVKMHANSNSRLLVGHQERFNPAIRAVEARLNDVKFIEARRMGQFNGRERNVDVITDLMIHDIDLILELIQSPVTDVSAMGSTVVSSHIDIANARIEFENGAVANAIASRVSDKKIRDLQIYVPKHYFSLDMLNQTVSMTSTLEESDEDGNTKVVIESIPVESKLTLKSEIDHFIDVIKSGVPPLVTCEDGLTALRVAEMVRDGVSQG